MLGASAPRGPAPAPAAGPPRRRAAGRRTPPPAPRRRAPAAPAPRPAAPGASAPPSGSGSAGGRGRAQQAPGGVQGHAVRADPAPRAGVDGPLQGDRTEPRPLLQGRQLLEHQARPARADVARPPGARPPQAHQLRQQRRPQPAAARPAPRPPARPAARPPPAPQALGQAPDHRHQRQAGHVEHHGGHVLARRFQRRGQRRRRAPGPRARGPRRALHSPSVAGSSPLVWQPRRESLPPMAPRRHPPPHRNSPRAYPEVLLTPRPPERLDVAPEGQYRPRQHGRDGWGGEGAEGSPRRGGRGPAPIGGGWLV